MNAAITEKRLVALSPEAHRTVCGLVQPTEKIDPAEVVAADQVWAEVRSAFPASEARVDEEVSEPSAPAAETTRIMVLADGESFSGLAGCRIFEVPAAWDTEEIEDALAEEAWQGEDS